MTVVWTDNSSSKAVTSFTVLGNYGTWVYLSQTLLSEELGNSEGNKIVSEISTDGLLLWMPVDAFAYIVEGDNYFDDYVIGSYVKAGELIKDEIYGEVRRIYFQDGFFRADADFRIEDGYLVRYHQYETAGKEFQIILTLKEEK
jgi:hypothetical protein